MPRVPTKPITVSILLASKSLTIDWLAIPTEMMSPTGHGWPRAMIQVIPSMRIAKTLSFFVADSPMLVVFAGDARIDNRRWKETFGVKAKMIPAELVEGLIGHGVGGVCPFGVRAGVPIHLDASLRRFATVFPTAGSPNSCVELSLGELELASGSTDWVDVAKLPD